MEINPTFNFATFTGKKVSFIGLCVQGYLPFLISKKYKTEYRYFNMTDQFHKKKDKIDHGSGSQIHLQHAFIKPGISIAEAVVECR